MKKDEKEWDILIFTQHWPVTVCYQWQEASVTHKCLLPPLNNTWTVHGIWPTKIGTFGPENCNTTWRFDPDQISPLMSQLQTYWIDIETHNMKHSIWKHEWEKHGTCAAEIPDFDTELKYFNKGLTLIYKYNMEFILSKSNIIPDENKEYFVEDIFDAIVNVIQKKPAIECYTDKHLNQTFLWEIRICFDKNLELIDCDGIRDPVYHIKNTSIITNCKKNTPIYYKNLVPIRPKPTTRPTTIEYDDENERRSFVHKVLDIYRVLTFLRWLTL